MPPIVLGQRFASLVDFKKALREWAVEKNFTPAILDSDTRRVRVGCRTNATCPFRLRANFHEQDGFARVTTCEDAHTCTSTTAGQGTNQEIKRAATCRLEFLVEAVPKLMHVDDDTTTKAIVAMVEQRYGQKIALRQAQKVKKMLVLRRQTSCGHCIRSRHPTKRCAQHRNPTNEGGEVAESERGGQAEDHAHSISHAEDGDNDDGRDAMVLTDPDSDHTCKSCLQTGHDTQQCRDDQHDNRQSNDITTPSGTASGDIAHRRASVDVQDQSNRQQTADVRPHSHVRHSGVPSATEASSNIQPETTNSTHQRQRTAADVRMEAAGLMHRAAWLMQEAAKLNVEAARLTASVANA
ncbi:hypothetical protein MMC09_006224 [Bachmanniomyces sp. S44760]|nr:hypothetical protein [Bachmanniomyces sp. S44760]